MRWTAASLRVSSAEFGDSPRGNAGPFTAYPVWLDPPVTGSGLARSFDPPRGAQFSEAVVQERHDSYVMIMEYI